MGCTAGVSAEAVLLSRYRRALAACPWVDGCALLTGRVLCCAVLCAGLPQLYGYMLTQRKKVLGGGGAAAAKGKAKAS